MVGLETSQSVHYQLQASMLVTTRLEALAVSHGQFCPLRAVHSESCPQKRLSKDVDGIVSVQLVVEDNIFADNSA